jgi:hypothetical protein
VARNDHGARFPRPLDDPRREEHDRAFRAPRHHHTAVLETVDVYVRAPHKPVPPPLRHDHSGLVTIATVCTFCTFVMRDNEPRDLVEFHLASSFFSFFFPFSFFLFFFPVALLFFLFLFSFFLSCALLFFLFLFSFSLLAEPFFCFFCFFAFFAF